jgi:hypothetical protein
VWETSETVASILTDDGVKVDLVMDDTIENDHMEVHGELFWEGSEQMSLVAWLTQAGVEIFHLQYAGDAYNHLGSLRVDQEPDSSFRLVLPASEVHDPLMCPRAYVFLCVNRGIQRGVPMS